MISVVRSIGKDIAISVASGAVYEAAKYGCEKGKDALKQIFRKWNIQIKYSACVTGLKGPSVRLYKKIFFEKSF